MQIETLYNTKEVKRFYFPGKIIVGKGVFYHAISLCRDTTSSIAIVADKFVFDMPFVQDAIAELGAQVIGTILINGSPVTQNVEKFVATFDEVPGVILAVGGGSTSDFAKAVAALFQFGEIDGLGLDGSPLKRQLDTKPLLVCVPTTAGSGAEASRYYVTYDETDNHKVFGKSWELVADWIMLDPVFLKSMPEDALVSCAFDVFVHLFESLICRHERSWMGEMFSVNGIAHLMEALHLAVYMKERNDDVHSALLETSTLGGVSISNVRTGNIHEAAGALLEVADLNHPETLFVFFREAIEQYIEAIRDHEELLVSHLKMKPAFEKINSLDDVVCWWEDVFAKVGLDSKVRGGVLSLEPTFDKVVDHVFQRVYSDKVWVTKESPVVLDEQAIKLFIERSFARFGLKK